ncbi:MAG: hypothetical protein EXR66_03525 [Dehalococcoidia bacterium]|nr:hypothetical protein [Dehalococcoidia bacterium]
MSRLLRARLRSFRGARFVLLILAFLALLLLPQDDDRSAANALDASIENSWIRIQNLGSQPATAEVAFYNLGGDPVATERCPTATRCASIERGRGWSFFQESATALERGYRGSAFLNIDQPFVAMLAKDVFRGNNFEIGGDTLRLGGGSSIQYAPLVDNTESIGSRITVQNTSSSDEACFELSFYAVGAGVATAVDPPGPTAGCPNGGRLVRPRGTLLRDYDNLPVPRGFQGSVVVRSRATSSGVRAESQVPMATVDEHNRSAAGLATSRMLGSDELRRVVVLPVADRGGSEGQSTWSSRFRVVSAEPGAANSVTLLFEGHDDAGGRVEIEHTISFAGALNCDLRVPGATGCLPADHHLPTRFEGTVRMQALEPIAVVAQRISPEGPFADYRGFTANDASRQVVLPVLNRNYGPWGGTKGWNSWFRVLTFDGSTAYVRVVYFAKEFPGGHLSPPVIVERERTFRQWEESVIPDGWVGSAIIISDQPIVVVANLESDVFSGDGVMMYNGVGLE